MPRNPDFWPRQIRRTRRRPAVVAVASGVALILAGCGRVGADWRQTAPAEPATDQAAGYVRPPRLVAADRAPDGAVLLSGASDPRDRIRLSAPGGQAYGATADDQGRWKVSIPPAADVRLFGLSEVLPSRVVQSEGYIAVLPAPGMGGVGLRAGVGAMVLGSTASTARILALDCDAAGGTVISGLARPGASLHLSVDGGAAVEMRADAAGRYSIAWGSSMKQGDHEAVAQSGGDIIRARFTIEPAAPISGLPYRGQRLPDRWRIDWITPGGGVQTTYILD